VVLEIADTLRRRPAGLDLEGLAGLGPAAASDVEPLENAYSAGILRQFACGTIVVGVLLEGVPRRTRNYYSAPAGR
jgi:hypothetical protein